jgi:hypothetical protein
MRTGSAVRTSPTQVIHVGEVVLFTAILVILMFAATGRCVPAETAV